MEHRKYKKKKSERTLISDIIVALCADYERRKTAVYEKSVSKRVRMEYIYINTRMLSAVGEIVGLAFAENFIHEIGWGIGYAASELECMSESTYKVMKNRIKRNIAKKLYLAD